MGKKIFSLLFCLILLISSSTVFADDDMDVTSDSSSTEDVVSVIKIKDPDTGEVVEKEIRNGKTEDGRIFLGVGKRKQDAATQQHVDETISNAESSGNAVGGLQLVENMRALIGKIPHWASGQRRVGSETNCVRTIGIAFQGTPYGTDTNYAGDISVGYGVGGYKLDEGVMVEMVNTEQLIAIARDLHQLIDSNNGQDFTAVLAYTPKPGDIAIVDTGSNSDHYQHAVVVKMNDDGSLGTISNGGSSRGNCPGQDAGGVYEDDSSPMELYGTNPDGPCVACYITSSVYAGFPIDTDLVSYLPGGNAPGSGGFSNAGSFSYEALMTIGESLNQVIQSFSEVSRDAYGRLAPHAFDIIALLAIIDLVMTIVLAGFEINPMRLFVKVLKYGFIYWIVIWWPDIVDSFMQTFAVSVGQTIYPDEFAEVSRNICQPHLLLQKVMFLLKPGFDFLKNMSFLDSVKYTFMGGWGFYLLGGLITFITMFVYFLFAVYIAYVYIAFFVFAGLSVISLPFMTSGFTKFFSEGSVGAVWTSAVRMMVLSFMMALMTTILPNAGFDSVNSMAAQLGAGNGLLVRLTPDHIVVFTWYIKQCCMLILFAFFTIKITDNITSKLGGRFEIQM